MAAFPPKITRPPTLSRGLRSMLPTRSSSAYPDEGMVILAEQSRAASLQARQQNLTLPDTRLLPMDQVWQELERSQAYKEGKLEPGSQVTPEGLFLLALERGDWELYQKVKDITLTAATADKIQKILDLQLSVTPGQVPIIWDLRSKFQLEGRTDAHLIDSMLISAIKTGNIELYQEILQSSKPYNKEHILTELIERGYNDLARDMMERLIREVDQTPLDELIFEEHLDSLGDLNELYEELSNHPLDWSPPFQAFLGGLGSALRDSNPDYEFDKYPDVTTVEEAELAKKIRDMMEDWRTDVYAMADTNRQDRAGDIYYEALVEAIKSGNVQFAQELFDDYMDATYELDPFWHQLNDLADVAAGLTGNSPMPEMLAKIESHLPLMDIPEKTRLRHICVAVCQGNIEGLRKELEESLSSDTEKYTRDIEWILLQSLQLSDPSIYKLLTFYPAFSYALYYRGIGLKQILNRPPSYRVSLPVLKFLQEGGQLDDTIRLLLIARSGTDNLETVSFLGEHPGLSPLEYWHAVTIMMTRTISKDNDVILSLLNSPVASEYLNLPVEEIRAEMANRRNIAYKTPQGKSLIETLLSMIGERLQSSSLNIAPVVKKLVSLSRTPINIDVFIWQHIEKTGDYDLYLFLLQQREYGRVKISDHGLQNFSLMLRQRGLIEMANLAEEYTLGIARKSMTRGRL